VSSYAERRKKRYAEDAEYRARTCAYNNAWHAAHKERVNADLRRKRAEDPDFNKKQRAYYAKSRGKAWLKYYYGITVADYEALLAKQNGKCAICREKPPRGETLCVDHCHVTGRIRGLLCRGCNCGLGNYRDDPRRLRAGAAYLEASRAADPWPAKPRPRASSTRPGETRRTSRSARAPRAAGRRCVAGRRSPPRGRSRAAGAPRA